MPLIMLLFVLLAGASAAESRPNFVLIITDDQRWDTLWATPNINALANEGVRFEQAFVTTPWCSPARASLYSGGYLPQNTKVVRNGIAFSVGFNDRDTLATNLQAAGYITGFVGKYFINYENLAPYIPPGWNSFAATAEPQSGLDWFNFQIARGSSTLEPGSGVIETVSEYVTDFQRDEALRFLDAVGDEPFFLTIATHAAHAPNTPAPEDEDLFQDFTYQGRAWNEQDLSDKPAWVAEWKCNCTAQHVSRAQLRTLQAVDRAVNAVRRKLAALGKADNTYIVLTSDNGHMWAEHQLEGKGLPYEESIRVPFIVFAPGAQPRIASELVSPPLDIGPTLYELAGINKSTDGASLLPILAGPGSLGET